MKTLALFLALALFLVMLLGCSADSFGGGDPPDSAPPDDANGQGDVVGLPRDGSDGDGGVTNDGDPSSDSASADSASGCGAIGKLTKLSCGTEAECLYLDPNSTPPKQWSYVCDPGSGVSYGMMLVGCAAQSDCPSLGFTDCCYQQAVKASGCATVLSDSGAPTKFYSAGGFAGTQCQNGCGTFPRVCSSDSDCLGSAHCVPVKVAPLDAGTTITFGVCQ